MKANKANYFQLIKENKNPNPYIYEVEEESGNSKTLIEISNHPTLNINRIMIEDKEKATATIEVNSENMKEVEVETVAVMEILWERRAINLINWFRELFVTKMYEWFDIPMVDGG
jgi:hypothetical protein